MTTTIPDGHYELQCANWVASRTAFLVMRDERFTGVTNVGVSLAGTCRYDAVRNLVHFDCTVYLPAWFEALTGLFTESRGRNVAVHGETTPGTMDKRFSIEFAGRAIDIALVYKGPLTEHDLSQAEPQTQCPPHLLNASSSPI